MSSFLPGFLRDWLPGWLNKPPPPPPPPNPPSDRRYRPQDAHDVYHVAFMLQHHLVPDLVPEILDLGEYWTKASHDRRDAQSYVEDTAGRPYLTVAVGNALRLRRQMVRKVEIRITSHDQGWSSYPHSHGTYDGSWTWFEAEIRSSDGDEETATCARRFLCRNVHAGVQDETHTVTWRYDAEDAEERNLIRSLGSGSVISIVPWARFPGWANHVSCATVDIYTAAVRRL